MKQMIHVAELAFNSFFYLNRSKHTTHLSLFFFFFFTGALLFLLRIYFVGKMETMV